MPEAPLLVAEGLRKRFGAVAAADGFSLSVAAGEIHALIGPNGAGKTTAIGQLSGEIAPDAGRVVFDGHDVTRLSIGAHVRLGLSRSYQITTVFQDFTAEDNVAVGVQAYASHQFRFWRPARRDATLREPAQRILERVGLSARADMRAADLAHGEKRQLELAMALSVSPRMVLLDEPMAGLGPTETAAMVGLLRRLREEVTILLVEHDMDVVFALADRVSVVVYGRTIATGTPEQIRADRDVREAYLGSDR